MVNISSGSDHTEAEKAHEFAMAGLLQSLGFHILSWNS